MDNRGLLFVPDISGFTKFVTETEIGHSRAIIQELLEELINANTMGLEVSEIEGDAILFYKFGDAPDMDMLYRQVEKMFLTFHKALTAYDHTKYCQCSACRAAIGLSLKVITHYGEFANYKVKNFQKLIGKDVIIAHQLLKNDITHHEYWLVTQELAGESAKQAPVPDDWHKSVKKTESGQIPFQYTYLTPLKENIGTWQSDQRPMQGKSKVLSLSSTYHTDIITLFHATGDFSYRSQWREGVRSIEQVNHHLPRVGMQCKCLLDSGEEVIYSSSYRYSSEKIEFSETDSRQRTTYYTLTAQDDHTHLMLDYYIPEGLFPRLLFSLFAKKELNTSWRKSMDRLPALISEIKERFHSAAVAS